MYQRIIALLQIKQYTLVYVPWTAQANIAPKYEVFHANLTLFHHNVFAKYQMSKLQV
jgi:hypothetical protein